MSAAPINSTISCGLTNRLRKITFASTPSSFARFCKIVPVFVAFPPQYVRMRYAGNHVDHVAVARQNLRQRFDYVFHSLIRRQQPKREQNFFSFRSESVLVKTRIGERQIWDAMRNQIDLVGRNVKHFLQNLRGLLAHHD